MMQGAIPRNSSDDKNKLTKFGNRHDIPVANTVNADFIKLEKLYNFKYP